MYLIRKFLTILFAFNISAQLYADSNEYDVEYLFLSINNKTANSFYKVLVKDNVPYIDVLDLLNNYLDFARIEYDEKAQRIKAVLPEINNIFWLDAKNLFYGNISKKTQEHLLKTHVIFYQNKIWLEFTDFRRWLPLKIEWDFRLYKLTIITSFKLLSQLKEEQELIKLQAQKRKLEMEKFKKQRPIKPNSTFRTEALYSVLFKYGEETYLGANLNTSTDIFKGNLRFGTTIRRTDGTTELTTPYYTYVQKDKKYYKNLELGNTFFRNIDLILPYIRLNNGFKIDNKRDEYNVATITIEDNAPIGTEVDLYIDGTYYATSIVGDDGRYKFKDITITPYSHVYVTLFFPDGVRTTKIINIARDNNYVLSKEKHTESFVLGQNRDGYLGYFGFRYGIINNLSLGMHYITIPSYNTPSIMFDIATKPFYGINFIFQNVEHFTETSILVDTATRINLSYLYPHIFQFEYKYINESSPLLYGNKNYVGDYYSLKHSVRLWKTFLRSEYSFYNNSNLLKSNLRFLVKNGLSMEIEALNSWTESSSLFLLQTGLNLATFLGRFSLKRFWNSSNKNYTTLAYTRHNSKYRLFSINLLSTLYDDGQLSFTGNVFINKSNFSIGTSFSNSYIGLNIMYRNILATHYKVNNWKDFSKGMVVGRITAPNNEPIPYVKVIVDNNHAYTDNNGYFIVSTITPYKKVKAYIDPESLPIEYYPEKDFDVLYLRPSTYIEYSPKLVRVSGFDCTIMTPIELNGDTVVRIFKTTDNTLFTSIPVEADGFFIVEKIPPGRYKLELFSPKLKHLPKPKYITIPENSSWISELTWNWE